MKFSKKTEQSGEGVWVQSSLLQSQAAMLSHVATNYLTSGQDGKRWGTAHPSLVPYQSFLSKDRKYITIGRGGFFMGFPNLIPCFFRKSAKNSC